MPYLGENIRAVSMESISFTIIGGDVGATQHRADTRTVHIFAAPLTLGTGAVNRVQSIQLDRLLFFINILLKIGSYYQFRHALEYDSPGLYGLPWCKQEHESTATHPLCVMSSKTVPWEKHNDMISLVCKVNCY